LRYTTPYCKSLSISFQCGLPSSCTPGTPALPGHQAHGSFEEVWDVNFKFIEKKFHRAVKKTAGYIEEANATKAKKMTSKL